MPWFGEIVSTPGVTTLQIRYASDGTLHLLGFEDGGNLLHGVLDNKDRSIDWGEPVVFEQDGVPYDPYATDSFLAFGGVDLAIRPGSDDVWMWLHGMAGPVGEDGVVDVTVTTASGAVVQTGGIAFSGPDTLLLSAGGTSDSDVQSIQLDGDVPTGEPETLTVNGTELQAFCEAEVQDNLLYWRGCQDGQIRVIDLDTQNYATFLPEDDDSFFYNNTAYTGTAADWVVSAGLDVAVCVAPRSEDGRGIVSTTKYKYEGNCHGMDANVGGARYGDIREDGDQFAVAYDNSLFIVFDRKAPRTRENKVAGSWCNGVTQFELTESGDFVPPPGSSDGLLFSKITYSYNGEVLTLNYKDPTPANFAWEGNVSIKHWMVRAGDTLNTKSYIHEKYETDGAGLMFFGGLFLPCGS